MEANMKYKAIFSDGGHVLFDDRPVKSLPYEFIKQFIPDLSLDAFLDGYTKHKRKAQTLPDYTSKHALRDYLEEIGRSDVIELLHNTRGPMPVSIAAREGVKDTLQAVKEAGIEFIIMTDATKTGEELKPVLAAMGLGGYVADVVSSKDVGVLKPDKKFFDYILEKHGLKKEEILFVGHDLDELKGASELGYDVCAVYYDEKADLSFLPEKRRLKSFSDILQAVNF